MNQKFLFHIPKVAYVNEEYISISYERFEDALGMKLKEIGIIAWYKLSSTGFFKGRCYPQDVMVVYCDESEVVAVSDVYKNVCREMADVMKQEQFAYEHNDELIIFAV